MSSQTKSRYEFVTELINVAYFSLQKLTGSQPHRVLRRRFVCYPRKILGIVFFSTLLSLAFI